MKKAICLLISLISITCQAQQTPFEKSSGNTSATYEQMISFYEKLDATYPTVKMEVAGPSDAAHPLHVVYYSNDKHFGIIQWKADGKLVLLINNGIHPGEPDGIDASMMLLRDAATGIVKIPENIVLAVIPVFNIGGMLNRGSYSRASQNGPEAYGFRGNAQNLDLNRDFIKNDARETQSLVKLFHKLDPDLFIDNHVSNGADYQHVMTLLATQHNKLGGSMGTLLNETLVPKVYQSMNKKGYDLVPYVNHFGNTPERGWTAFHEGPRFASGFTALFHTYGFVPETHMLKPFAKRVDATYELMRSFIAVASKNAELIKSSRSKDIADCMEQKTMTIEWKADTATAIKVNFRGYIAGYKQSAVSGKDRLYYDRNKPYTKEVSFQNTYIAKQTVTVPQAYVLQAGWHKVINKMMNAGVDVYELEHDTTLMLTCNYIEDYETVKRPYEGHYLHFNIKAKPVSKKIKLLKGDCVIWTNQPARRYIVETLEATAPDGFFAWGFFDAVLQQKEGYSDYVFEDEAAVLLKNDAALRAKLHTRKKADTAFANSGEAQLDFVYHNSPYFEPVYMRHPAFRLEPQIN